MLNELKIGSKITVLLLTGVLLAVLVISTIAYTVGRQTIEERYTESIKIISNLKEKELETVFNEIEYSLEQIKNAAPVQKKFLDLRDSLNTQNLNEQLDNYFSSWLSINQDVASVILIDREGKIIFSSQSEKNYLLLGQKHPQFDLIRKYAITSTYFHEPYESAKQALILAGYPILGNQGGLFGYILMEYSMDKIYQITNDTTGLRATGEILIGKLSESGKSITLLNQFREKSTESLFTHKISIGDENLEALQKAVQGFEGNGISKDDEGKKCLSEWKYIRKTAWGLVVKIDQEEINRDLDFLIKNFIYFGIFIIFISWAIARIYSQFLIRPLIALKNVLQIVAKGILPNQIQRTTNDEIGEMALAVSDLVATLRRTALFARSIGDGNYEAEFKPMSHQDILGNALISMRNSIQESEIRDNERTWIVSGVAQVGQIVRLHDNLEELGDNLIYFIVNQIKAIQGAFYSITETEEEQKIIEMHASYAYSRKKYLKKHFKFGEGLVGQAVLERDTILRTEIPDDYMSISSGILGDRKPKCLLIVPLITDEVVYGVLELAGFERFTEAQVKFVEEISLLVARTIFNIKVNARTAQLLEESQQMSQELRLQQEVLRQNAEEMEATQEELRRTNTQLEEQILEVKRTQKRMQLLLENASEVITIYEKNGTIRYISPSVKSILGYSQEEMIGIKDIGYVTEETKAIAASMFPQLIENPEERITLQYAYQRKDKTVIWLEATGTNLLNDAAVKGIIVNLRDITERRRAEKEARMRGQMQSLSENSPDLIARLDQQGKIFYINPTISRLTGLRPTDLLGKDIHHVKIPREVAQNWQEMLEEVMNTHKNTKREIYFPTSLGERIMKVNAIAEANSENTIETILLVSNDITEQKNAELAILSINKKITESINYSKRIQSAIMPDSSALQKMFPKSFIYYKPKDVVSGDFPWFVSVNGSAFVAAVDCTGHGVPGALISLIGYFILNEIVNTKQVSDVGTILDLLDLGVTKTLRQDMNSTTRDGMDIALCKINLSENKVYYAGAHRPLFYVRKGKLTEIKGDRFPIGGGDYKLRSNFISHELEIKQGDALYLFSDGLIDQFGGDENRKFSPQRLRDIVTTHHEKNMNEMYEKLDEAFENWRKNRRQTDDVLLIGIKF